MITKLSVLKNIPKIVWNKTFTLRVLSYITVLLLSAYALSSCRSRSVQWLTTPAIGTTAIKITTHQTGNSLAQTVEDMLETRHLLDLRSSNQMRTKPVSVGNSDVNARFIFTLADSTVIITGELRGDGSWRPIVNGPGISSRAFEMMQSVGEGFHNTMLYNRN